MKKSNLDFFYFVFIFRKNAATNNITFMFVCSYFKYFTFSHMSLVGARASILLLCLVSGGTTYTKNETFHIHNHKIYIQVWSIVYKSR